MVESFRELASKKSIDKITVKDITSNCGYSSATFYRQFQDKYDLIAWDYANKTERVLNQIGRDDFEWRDALRETAIRYQKEKDYLSNLLLHTSGHDAFIGENELPLYTYLKSQKGFEGFGDHEYKDVLEKMFDEADPDWDKKPDIKWNFTKFVIDREGNVVARFEPTADMAEVEACVKALL